MTQIMVALDVSTPTEAMQLMQKLPQVGWWKIGLELASHPSGLAFVRDLVGGDFDGEKKSVFLDLKLDDIPTTVERAVANIYRHACPAYLSVRASGEALSRAMWATDPAWMTIVHVPSLTSDSHEQALAAIGATPAKAIVTRASLASHWKMQAPDLELIVPGLRLSDQPSDDHREPAPCCPEADYIVVGRPITRAPDPKVAYDAFVAALGSG
jgi:orotidine-5'-phosphate decarboxylase